MVVSDHTELGARYSDAKEHRKNIRLILQNIHSCRIEPINVSSGNWNSSGVWIGNERTGWAGGALPFRPRVGSFSSSNERNDKGRWSDQKMSSWEGSSSPRKASFSPNSIVDDEVQVSNAPALPEEDYIVRVIRKKSWRELIDFLEKGPDFSKGYVQQVLQRQYRYVGTELKKLNSSSSVGETNGFQKPMWERLEWEHSKRQRQAESAAKIEDLKGKKKILKLYINSAHLIEKAMALRNWTAVLIEIKFIELFHLPLEYVPGRSRVISTKVQTKSPDVDLCHLPVESTRHRISYASNNEVSMHNNYIVSLENRKVVVEISEGDPKLDQVYPKKLGEFVLTLNEIEKQCPSEGHWKDIENRSEAFGIIGFRAKRHSAHKKYVVNKRQEILDMLKTQLETVERFNREYCHSNSSRLTSNARGIYGIPLLYASVRIMADEALIQKILSLGGDPRKPPGRGSRAECTPLELARRQYDRCKVKARDAWGSKSGFQQASAQKSAQAKRLLDVLEAAK